jgi:lipopolysaccharide export system ATP-binding protein
MGKVLAAYNLKKQYKERVVVRDISFKALSGEITGILGPNGAGKTTFFYMLMGLVMADSGRVLLDEADITSLPLYQRARIGLGYLPQEVSIFRGLTVADNIMAVLEMRHEDQQVRKQILDEILEQFAISHLRSASAVALSGGERRRLEIARAMAMQPTFLLLDEPFAGVDPIAIAEIKDLILKLKAQGTGVIITDHNVRDALPMTDRSYVIYDGEVLAEGAPNDIIANQQVKERYLGDAFVTRGL